MQTDPWTLYILYLYWVVSIVGPFTFIAAFVHLFAVKVKFIGRIAGAIVSALKSPPDDHYSVLLYCK